MQLQEIIPLTIFKIFLQLQLHDLIIYQTKFQIRPFVHNFACLQILEGLFRNFRRVFAILFEVLLIEIQEEIHHFAGWEGGVKGHKKCEQTSCEQTGVS